MDRNNKKPSRCAPVRYRANRGGSCLSDNDIRQLAAALKVPMALLSADTSLLRQWIGTKLGMSHESQWPDHPHVIEATKMVPSIGWVLNSAFRPKHPVDWLKSPRAWLSNFDIEAVMRQYKDAFSDFRFVGVFPSDFSSPRPYSGGQCVSAAMCALNVKGLRSEGVKRVGIIFNLDKHTGSGTHWTGMYIGLDPLDPSRFGVWYYDSIGRAAMPEMARFMKRMKTEAATEFPHKKFKLWQNRTQKQFKNTECGIYAMFFVVACLTTKLSVPTIARSLIHNDDEIHRLRSVFFRPPTNKN